MSVLLLGSGYLGSAFAAELNRRKIKFECPPRRWIDYGRFDALYHYTRSLNPEFVINAAGFSGKPNVDACEEERSATLRGNLMVPIAVSNVCSQLDIPWLHVSSGCIYNNGTFTETDTPNFTFEHPPCSFYSGSKALAEEFVATHGRCYVCRPRLPFDEFDGPRNYLSKLQRYSRLYEATNSISHRGDFVDAALDLWQLKAPVGIYNMTNPGSITTRQVVMMIHTTLHLDREWEFFENDGAFYKVAVAPRSNCVLDVSKLLTTGVRMRPVEEAVMDALRHWRKEKNLAAPANRA